MAKIDRELAEVDRQLQEEKVDPDTYLYDPSIQRLHFTNLRVRESNARIRRLIARRQSLLLTHARYRRFRALNSIISTESDTVFTMTEDKDMDVYENFEDIAGSQVDRITGVQPETLDTGQVNLLDMGDFLSRPIKLAQGTATLGSNFTMAIDVWEEFLSHASVRAKLRNYAYLRGKLKVRITVSGTPWHFGKLQVSYQPLAKFNANLDYLVPQLGTSQRICALTYLSQAKGSRVIDVHDNKPLEIECPFISPQPMGRLFNKSPLILAAADGYDDFDGFGTLYINSIGTIEAVAGGSPATSVGVQVYAWMEDLQLGCPTGTVIEVSTESDTKQISDERVVGPVERISSKLASAASFMSKVPIIGPFATAAVAPLKAVSSVASLFGFSYPTIIDKPSRVKNEPFQNSSQFIGCDTGQRLTIDPKQELSVDPRSTGTEEDEMAYSHIASVETLIDQFVWSSSDGQLASSIWMAPVNPRIAKRILVAAGPPPQYVVAPSALAFVATTHEWWRGDITFRFEVICSKFHRGSLAILYEPNISQNVVIDTVLDLNKQYVTRIDLQTTTDFEFTVKWAFPRPWARVMPDSLMGDLGTVGFLGDALFEYANGYIAVIPYTELQSPDGSDITINVYIKSDNMHFNRYNLAKIPTARPSIEADTVFSPATPNPVENMDLNNTTATEDNISLFTFGEQPISYRSALRRFSPWRNNSTLKLTAAYNGPILRYITYPWSTPTPSYGSAASDSTPNLFGYLRLAYLGFRGGIKWRFSLAGPVSTTYYQNVVVSLEDSSTTVPSSALANFADYQRLSPSSNGSAVFNATTNGGFEVEWPMYTTNLFLLSFNEDLIPNTSIMDKMMNSQLTFYIPTRPGTPTATDALVVNTSCAAAEDFSLMRFSGAPVYQYTG